LPIGYHRQSAFVEREGCGFSFNQMVGSLVRAWIMPAGGIHPLLPVADAATGFCDRERGSALVLIRAHSFGARGAASDAAWL